MFLDLRASRSGIQAYNTEELYRAIVGQVPELYELARRMHEPLHGFLSALHGTRQPSPAEHATSFITAQAANDFNDLLSDCTYGRGRPALRAARSLFELLVTARDVWASQTDAERYLDHEVVGNRIAAGLRFETERLSGKERQVDEHERKKLLRESNAQHADVIRRYGTSFEARWASTDLRTRASSHGLDDDYDAYRLGSIILHGAAGGVLGLAKELRGSRVYRTGPAFSIAPLALLLGIKWFDELVGFIGPKMAEHPAKDLRAILQALRRAWPAYRRALLDLDSDAWPDPPPAPPVALLAIIPLTGKEQWFIDNVEANELYPADPPDRIPPLVQRGIEEIRQKIQREVPMSTEWITTVIPSVTLRPTRGGKAVDAARVLVKRPAGGWPKTSPSPDNPKTWFISGLTPKERKAALRNRSRRTQGK